MTSAIAIHPAWDTHPIVERSLDMHGGLNVDSLQCILDTVDEFEERFPGIGLGPLTGDVDEPADLAATLRAAGVCENDIALITGEEHTVRAPGWLRSNEDGLTARERARFAVADMRESPAELKRSSHPAVAGMGRSTIDHACALKNPMNDTQREVVRLRRDRVPVREVAEQLGISPHTITCAMERDRYHQSRQLHDYAPVRS